MSKKRSQYIAIAALIAAVVVLAIIVANIFLAQNAANDAIAKQSQITPAPKTAPKVIDPASVDPKDLYTFDCEITEQKPTEILQYCADGGGYVYKIKWQKWSPYGSTGTGIYSVNICEPNCAEGTRKEVPVTIALSDLFELKGKIYLRTLVLDTIDSKELPNGGTSVGWDVADFAIDMNWD